MDSEGKTSASGEMVELVERLKACGAKTDVGGDLRISGVLKNLRT